MIWITAALILLLAFREHQHTRQTQTQIQEAQLERAQLLDRIQHPEVRQVQAGPQVDYEPPRDTAELAHVGMEVPEFVQVGSFANEIATIGEHDGA